jgi:hypothetical protein
MIGSMSRVVAGIVVVASVAAAPVASAAPPQTVTWADWVGAYAGKLAWHNCTAPGERSATLAVDAADGVLSIDLAPASPGLDAMSLVADAHGWAGQQGDVEVRIARPRPDLLDVLVELDSGCTMKGRLKRASSGIAACDRLLGWARVEARCTKLREAPLEDLAKLVATKWRKPDDARCTARATKLETSLIDAGCAPHPDPLIGVRARDCLELAAASAKLARCGTVPAAAMSAIAHDAQALSSAAQSAERATLPYVEQQCRDSKAMLATIAMRFHCPL